MKLRNCEKLLRKFLIRHSSTPGTTYATSKEYKACIALNKYKPNKSILCLVHPYINRITKRGNLSVWIGG